MQKWPAALLCGVLLAADHQGQVRFNTLPVPGATVTAKQGERAQSTITNPDGSYHLDLTGGPWTIEVALTGFATERREIATSTKTEFDLKMLSLGTIPAQQPTPAPAPTQTTTPKPRSGPDLAEMTQRAVDSFLINGSTTNGAASPFSQSGAFGNNRRNQRGQYNGSLGWIMGNSALDARPYSLTGQNTLRPAYLNGQGLASFGGPLKLRRWKPNVILNYQWTRNRNVSTQSGLVPNTNERGGIFPSPVRDPLSGAPFASNTVPASRISPQARTLLALYPQPNAPARYNYQVPLVRASHEDSLQSRFNQRIKRQNQLLGNFSFQSVRAGAPTLFQFLDTSRSLGLNAGLTWFRLFRPGFYGTFGAQFSRLNARLQPYFADRANIAREAGINGTYDAPAYWGPPTLTFAGGISPLIDGAYSRTRNQTAGANADIGWNRAAHNVTFGGSFRRQQFNVLAQEDARGSFTFTGAAAGNDFAGFLLGLPDASAIAYGNADKYLRATLLDGYVADDWRLKPGFTLNLGLRYEYASPVSERQGRLVNLALAPSFASAAPNVTGQPFQPDRNNFAPRLALAWRPWAANSTLIRAGYGIYYDTSVYQPIALQMAQQSPLSNTLRVQSTAANPLTLARGFNAPAALLRNTFAVDPFFRVGYSQNWQASLQGDLPRSFVLIATYQGGKGTRAQQQILPNTFPGSECGGCPAGFAYLMSNGNSIRHAGQFELRRRLKAGFTSTLNYTWAKSIDNAALGGRNQSLALTAQNWLNLRAERGLSVFDQRHLINWQTQYTTPMRANWRALREWTMASTLGYGTGQPLNPLYAAAVRGTGVTNTIRPDYTGQPLYQAQAGAFLNRAAFTAPAAGQWGNAGRNSITGPAGFTLNASAARTIRLSDRFSLDARLDAGNVLNHPVFPSWNAVVTSAQFGLPTNANAMRSLQSTLRVRF